MAEPGEVSMDEFRVLVRTAGLGLTADEIESLKPLYDYYRSRTATLHELDLDAEDLAVVFPPEWESPEQAGEALR